MIKNSSLNKSKFSSGFFSFKHGKKSKLSVFFSARFEIVTFMSERKVLYEFLQKCFKTTERHNLVVCASLCGKKHFFVNIYPLSLVWSKQLFKQIQIFLRIFQFSKMVRKTNYLSISVIVFEIVTFVSKKKNFLWISKKIFKTTERHSLAVCGSLCGEKQFLLIFIPFYWFDQKKLVK